VALYGLANMRDERLGGLLRKGRVLFAKPPADAGSWYNILVLHQNREDSGRGKACFKHENIPQFIDVVLWGHEHPSMPRFEQVMNDPLSSGQATAPTVPIRQAEGGGA